MIAASASLRDAYSHFDCVASLEFREGGPRFALALVPGVTDCLAPRRAAQVLLNLNLEPLQLKPRRHHVNRGVDTKLGGTKHRLRYRALPLRPAALNFKPMAVLARLAGCLPLVGVGPARIWAAATAER